MKDCWAFETNRGPFVTVGKCLNFSKFACGLRNLCLAIWCACSFYRSLFRMKGWSSFSFILRIYLSKLSLTRLTGLLLVFCWAWSSCSFLNVWFWRTLKNRCLCICSFVETLPNWFAATAPGDGKMREEIMLGSAKRSMESDGSWEISWSWNARHSCRRLNLLFFSIIDSMLLLAREASL